MRACQYAVEIKEEIILLMSAKGVDDKALTQALKYDYSD